MFVPMILP